MNMKKSEFSRTNKEGENNEIPLTTLIIFQFVNFI